MDKNMHRAMKIAMEESCGGSTNHEVGESRNNNED